MSVEGVVHISSVEFLDITNIEEEYHKLGKWILASPLKRARSGLALLRTLNGGLIAYGGWPFTDESITIEENVNIQNESKWLVVDDNKSFG